MDAGGKARLRRDPTGHRPCTALASSQDGREAWASRERTAGSPDPPRTVTHPQLRAGATGTRARPGRGQSSKHSGAGPHRPPR